MSDIDRKLIPPQNIEIEQALLGALLLDEKAIDRVVSIIIPEVFYHKDHQEIFTVMVDLWNRSKPIDIITISAELKNKNILEKIGGLTYLTSLADNVPGTANVEYYGNIIFEKFCRREVIRLSAKFTESALREDKELKEVFEEIERGVYALTQKNLTDACSLKDVLLETMKEIDENLNRKTLINGVPSGFPDLDNITLGFQKSDLIILGARTSMGKTSLALNISANAAIRYSKPIAIFTLEMSKEQLALRMLSSEAHINLKEFRTGKLSEKQYQLASQKMHLLSTAPIYIDETTPLSITEMRSKIRRLKKEKNIQLVVVDYLQLMEADRRAENRALAISEISRSLKSLAKELKIPIIALSQLSRETDKRDDRIPQLHDLRESGSIEQDADLVLFIFRKGYYDIMKAKEKNKDLDDDTIRLYEEQANLIIAKNRNGPVTSIDMVFKKDYAKFIGAEKDRIPPPTGDED